MKKKIIKLIKKKVNAELKESGLKGEQRAFAYMKGVRETKKAYKQLSNNLLLPKIIPISTKQHGGESQDDFKKRRKVCNTKRREREILRKPQKTACLNCGETGPHFVPPSCGEDGFFICEKKKGEMK